MSRPEAVRRDRQFLAELRLLRQRPGGSPSGTVLGGRDALHTCSSAPAARQLRMTESETYTS